MDCQIIQAIKDGNFEEARNLARANPFGTESVMAAFEVDHFELLYQLYELAEEKNIILSGFWENVLNSGRVDIIDFLFVEKGLDPNILNQGREGTVFSMACCVGTRDVVERLLALGADPEIQNTAEWNSFFEAVLNEDVNVLRLLILKTGRLDYVDYNGCNLLHQACHFESCREVFDEIMNLLSWDINAQCTLGQTALHIAVEKHRFRTELSHHFLKLIEHPDIDFNIPDIEGNTVIDLCNQMDSPIGRMMLEKLTAPKS